MKKVWTAVLILVVLLAGWFFISWSGGIASSGVGTFSNGFRTGFVVKFSYKGTALKSWEGEMIVGWPGMMAYSPEPLGSTPTVGSQIWRFSVVEDNHQGEVAAILHAMEAGQWVRLGYDQKRIRGVGVDTDYLITKVSVIGDPTQGPNQ